MLRMLVVWCFVKMVGSARWNLLGKGVHGMLKRTEVN